MHRSIYGGNAAYAEADRELYRNSSDYDHLRSRDYYAEGSTKHPNADVYLQSDLCLINTDSHAFTDSGFSVRERPHTV